MALIEIDADGNELTPEFLRRRGLRAAVGAEVRLRAGDASAEPDARAALDDLVDAFLHNRHGNADLFRRAHLLGRILSETVGCRWKPGAKQYELNCAIFALHRQVAHSIAWTLDARCSICEAEPFTCDHAPGEIYDGEVCGYGAGPPMPGLHHIAWTANPDFIYTWHQPKHLDVGTLKARGTIKRAGDPVLCTHCESCFGIPDEGDLDPVTRYRRAGEAHADDA
jgi:hypothetical protein